jgi:hypothetical protein
VIIGSVFSSPELKAQVSFSDRPLSIICLLNIYIFDFFSRTTGPISTKLGRKHLLVKGIQVSSNDDDRPFPMGDNGKNAKIYRKI